jgi:nucleotide-binding universal stress UspA family protein
LPILVHAERVAILCASPKEDSGDRASAEQLATQLLWHGIKAELQMDIGDAGSTADKLRKMAYHCDADLLVMGAYGHSRAREFLFGGVTRGMLNDCALPVLMLH